jgi:hydrogenase maturation factor HypE
MMGKPLSEKLVFLEAGVRNSSVSFVDDFRLYQFVNAENKEFMDSIRSTYSSLCKYVHRSPEQIEEALRQLQRGISPGFETAQELKSLCRELAQLYDLVLVMHFNALGMGPIFPS